MHQVNEPDAFTLSLLDIREKLHETITAWKDHKKHQKDLREAFEKKVNEHRAITYGTSIEAQTKQQRNAGATKNIFRNIKRVMKPTDRLAISTVEYTASNGQTVECLSRTDIEAACKAEGLRRFTQAQQTPFLAPGSSLLNHLGVNANPLYMHHILDGSYIPAPDVDIFTCEFLKELTMPNILQGLPPITGVVSTHNHQRSWKKMRLNTGSSPYGPLFCDYIAGAQDPIVLDIDASLSSIPYHVGFSPSQWQEASNVMIPKKRTSRHVQKLCIIILFDAMFNMTNKRIAQHMLSQARQHNVLPDEAYGGVPTRRASTCSLNKILSLDIIRLGRRRIATLCSNDAKSCYNRIVHTVASLSMQRLGVNPKTCFTMFSTLQALNHHVRYICVKNTRISHFVE